MSTLNGRFRKKKIYYTQVSNTALRDKKLSLQAKGLYAIIQSYITIEDFILYKSHLIKESGVSDNTFDKYWKELKDRGYLVQYKFYDTGSKGAKYEYELLDTPKEEVFTPQNLRSKNFTPQNLRSKNLGVYNNTDLNNTDLNNTNNTTQQNACSDNKVIENKNLIETYTHLKLSNNMLKQISKWDFVRLELAVKIFIQRDGKYFAMLKKIYEDDGNFAKKNPNQEINPKSFNNFVSREYDYDDLERKLLGWDK